MPLLHWRTDTADRPANDTTNGTTNGHSDAYADRDTLRDTDRRRRNGHPNSYITSDRNANSPTNGDPDRPAGDANSHGAAD